MGNQGILGSETMPRETELELKGLRNFFISY